jgi:hypothetical protein
VSCLADTQEGSIPTQDEVKDCLNTAGGSEEDGEDNRSINDNDAIISSDEAENSNAPLNSMGRVGSDIEDSNQSDEDDE